MTDYQMTGNQLKILIVDDDAFFRQLVNRILTSVGYHVLEARSVGDAISALEQGPDLAIIDYRMPGTDGASFIKQLRENNYKFPIVFCSGSGMDQKTFASMRNVYHVDLIIQKPIHHEMFVQQISELLYERQNKVGSQNHTPVPEPDTETETIAEAELNQYEAIEPKYAAIEQVDTEEQTQAPILNDQNQTLDEFLRQSNLLPETEASPASAVKVETEEEAQARRETEEAIAELACIYLLELPNELEQMTIEIMAAAAQHDTSALSQATNRAHQIKGTAGSLSFDALSQIGAVLEKKLIALGKEDVDSEDQRWDEVLASLEQAKAWIMEKVEELDPGEPIEATVPVVPLVSLVPVEPVEPVAPLVPELSGLMIVESINLDQNTTNRPQGRLLPPRVLVVANNRELISGLTSILEEERLTVTSITSSMEAFSVLDDFQPELILLQATMPSVSGNDVCRMIRCNSRWQTIPILILSDINSCTVESRQKVYEAGASDFVLTPLAPLELKAKLKSYLPLTSNSTSANSFLKLQQI